MSSLARIREGLAEQEGNPALDGVVLAALHNTGIVAACGDIPDTSDSMDALRTMLYESPRAFALLMQAATKDTRN